MKSFLNTIRQYQTWFALTGLIATQVAGLATGRLLLGLMYPELSDNPGRILGIAVVLFVVALLNGLVLSRKPKLFAWLLIISMMSAVILVGGIVTVHLHQPGMRGSEWLVLGLCIVIFLGGLYWFKRSG